MDGARPVTIAPEGFQFPEGKESATVPGAIVDEHYFDTMGLPILKGRGFRATDSADAPKVAVVNEVLAQRYWPGQDPVGKRFRLDSKDGAWVEVVGLAKTSKYIFIIEPPREFVYLPYKQRPQQRMSLLTESVGDPSSLVTPLREVVRSLDANQPIFNVRTMEEFYRMRTVVTLKVVSGFIAAMGMMGLALAIVGLYGLVAYAVSSADQGDRHPHGDRRQPVRPCCGWCCGKAWCSRSPGSASVCWRAWALAARWLPSFQAVQAATAEPISSRSRWSRRSCSRSRSSPRIVPARRASRINPTEALRNE